MRHELWGVLVASIGILAGGLPSRVVEASETSKDGTRLDVRGISPLVRDQRAVFFAHEGLDEVTPLHDPERAIDLREEARDGRLPGAGVAGEDEMAAVLHGRKPAPAEPSGTAPPA